MTVLGNYKFEWLHAFDREQNAIEITQVFNRHNKRISVGRVVIDPDTKKLSKDTGRKESMKHALSKSGLTKKQRENIWEDYRTKMTETPRWSKK